MKLTVTLSAEEMFNLVAAHVQAELGGTCLDASMGPSGECIVTVERGPRVPAGIAPPSVAPQRPPPPGLEAKDLFSSTGSTREGLSADPDAALVDLFREAAAKKDASDEY